jgi:P27 family predicted phage terminase small subunit
MPTPRKPRRLKVLAGDKVPENPRWPDLADEKPPTWLDREGKREWRRVVEHLQRYPGWLQCVDRPGLAVYCATWAIWLAAAKDVAKRGPLVPGRSSADAARSDDGEPVLVKNPSAQIMRDAGIQLRAWCREFGFSPDSRGRLDLGSLREPSSADRFFTHGSDLLTGPNYPFD